MGSCFRSQSHLVDHGANREAKDDDGKTAYDYAGHTDLGLAVQPPKKTKEDSCSEQFEDNKKGGSDANATLLMSHNWTLSKVMKDGNNMTDRIVKRNYCAEKTVVFSFEKGGELKMLSKSPCASTYSWSSTGNSLMMFAYHMQEEDNSKAMHCGLAGYNIKSITDTKLVLEMYGRDQKTVLWTETYVK